jgi:hypothetical protein
VDVERSCARKVQYNARGVVGLRCNLNLRHYYKAHWISVCFIIACKCYTHDNLLSARESHAILYSSKVLYSRRLMGSTPTRGELRRSVTETVLDKYSKWLTDACSSLLIQVNGSNNVVEQMSCQLYNILRVGRPPLQSHKLGASQVQILDPLPFMLSSSIGLGRCPFKAERRVRFSYWAPSLRVRLETGKL